MKIMGQKVNWMVDIAPETYRRYVVLEQGKKVLYIIVIKVTYGMLESSMMWYQELKLHLEGHGFEFNLYDA